MIKVYRNNENHMINILKGIAVLAVLIGHAIQRGMPEKIFTEFLLVKIIYTFHMPLFVLLSGYIMVLSKSEIDFNWIKKKFRRLMIPFISWNLILWFLRDFNFTGLRPFIKFPDTFYKYIKWQIFHPDAIFWFLYLIFACNVIFYIANKISKKRIQIVLVILCVVINFIPQQYFGVDVISFYLPIFTLGYFLAKYKKHILKGYKFYVGISIILFPILAPRWSGNSNNIYKYIVAFTGIVLIYWAAMKIKSDKVKKCFRTNGKNIFRNLCLSNCLFKYRNRYRYN